jgi:hypothetical protein
LAITSGAAAQRLLFLAHDPHKEKARREAGLNFIAREADDQK